MTKVIGLTGGIGSGKTTIGKYFSSLGIPVYIADDEARKIAEQPKVIEQIKNVFGAEILNKGKIDRAKLAQVVFNDSEKLSQLNQIIHPAVGKHFANWLQQHGDFPWVIKEAAILFESGSYKDCDFVITVTAPLQTRISRVMARDKIFRDSILSRIKNQWTDEQRAAKSDFIIQNTDLEEAKKQAIEILKKLSIQ